MNTRISWKRNIRGFSEYESNYILCNDILVKAVLYFHSLEGCIYDLDTMEDLVQFEANSLSALKKKAKAELIKLGAKFNSEIRNRGNTEKLDLEKL